MKEATCEKCEFYDPPSHFCYRKGHYVTKQEWCCGFIRKEEKEMKSIHIEDLSTYSIKDLKKLQENITDLIKEREKESYLNVVQGVLDAINLVCELGLENEDAIDTGIERFSWRELIDLIKDELVKYM